MNTLDYSDRLYIGVADVLEYSYVCTAFGGFDELIAFPPLKTPPANDWHEERGFDPDLSDPVLDTREVTLRLSATGQWDYEGAIGMLEVSPVIDVRATSIGRSWSLRFIAPTGGANASTFGLKFADDTPMQGYTYQPPNAEKEREWILSTSRRDDFVITESPKRSFADYGARVLGDVVDEMERRNEVKTGLLRKFSTKPGAFYDKGALFNEKGGDRSVQLLMRADTLAELWRNYDALLFDLIRPGARRYKDAPFYYSSCHVDKFIPDEPRPWLQFTLTLTFYEGSSEKSYYEL
jgi:hypothetical protein|nr:MAG TPA: hypothetical protein [Caudoviricetes sp.]